MPLCPTDEAGRRPRLGQLNDRGVPRDNGILISASGRAMAPPLLGCRNKQSYPVGRPGEACPAAGTGPHPRIPCPFPATPAHLPAFTSFLSAIPARRRRAHPASSCHPGFAGAAPRPVSLPAKPSRPVAPRSRQSRQRPATEAPTGRKLLPPGGPASIPPPRSLSDSRSRVEAVPVAGRPRRRSLE